MKIDDARKIVIEAITSALEGKADVAGLEFMASEVERVALRFDGVELAKAEGKPNPIPGQHVELKLRPAAKVEIDKGELKAFLASRLPGHMVPQRLRFFGVAVSHRFKSG